MRLLIAALALASGCFRPSTDSCKYQCATQGTPCPAGLTCVNGMCAAEGDTCVQGDGGPMCGDGVAVHGEICYGLPIRLAVGSGMSPRDGQLADINGDARLDLVFAEATGVYAIAQTTSGTFVASPTRIALTSSVALRVHDLDGTAPPELVSANGSATRVETWSNGAMGYQLASDRMLGTGFSPIEIAVGHATNTTEWDAIVLSSTALKAFHYGTGFTVTDRDTITLDNMVAMAVRDANGDGYDDVAIAYPSGVYVVGGGDGSLQIGGMATISGPASDIAIGDIGGDGMADLVVTRIAPGEIAIANGTGNFGFETFGTAVVDADLEAPLAVTDLDGDHHDDVIAIREGASAAVVIGRGLPTGALAPFVEIPLVTGATYIHASADFNGDSVPDIVLTDVMAGEIIVLPSSP